MATPNDIIDPLTDHDQARKGRSMLEWADRYVAAGCRTLAEQRRDQAEYTIPEAS